jgi:hypothetical protein
MPLAFLRPFHATRFSLFGKRRSIPCRHDWRAVHDCKFMLERVVLNNVRRFEMTDLPKKTLDQFKGASTFLAALGVSEDARM